jgi:hypothetical protein
MHPRSKLCGISALPSKTDFKARTARFQFEGTLVWKVSESENVLVLFCFCSIVSGRHLETAKWQPNGNCRRAVDRRLIGGRSERHFWRYDLRLNDVPKNGGNLRAAINRTSYCYEIDKKVRIL